MCDNKEKVIALDVPDIDGSVHLIPSCWHLIG